MENAQTSDRRSSDRVIVPVPLLIVGHGADGKAFEEETHTLRVNAAGGSITLAAPVRMAQRVKVTHRKTNQTADCKVVYIGPQHEKKLEVGLEFVEPAPNFWGPPQ